MKTKELIRLLQEADPTGEEEACVGNVDIHFVEALPAYYDGALQVLKRDESKSPYYNIVGGKYVRSGTKVVIHTLSITDALHNAGADGEFEVDYSELPTDRIESAKKSHEEIREWHRKLDVEMEMDYFVKWAKAKAEILTPDIEEMEGMAKQFFEDNVSPTDPLPEGGIPLGHSYVTTREMQWNERFEISIDEGFLKIAVKETQ